METAHAAIGENVEEVGDEKTDQAKDKGVLREHQEDIASQRKGDADGDQRAIERRNRIGERQRQRQDQQRRQRLERVAQPGRGAVSR